MTDMQALWNQDFANHSALVEAGIVPRWFCCFAMRGPSEGFVRQGRGQLKTSRLNICPEGAALHLGLGRAYLCVLFEKIWCSPHPTMHSSPTSPTVRPLWHQALHRSLRGLIPIYCGFPDSRPSRRCSALLLLFCMVTYGHRTHF